MCGIGTLYEPSAPAWLGDVAHRMMRHVRHRGPDGEGFTYFYPSSRTAVPVSSDATPAGVSGTSTPPPGAVLVLGHRRLSILDLSAAGHQPMSDASGELWLTFNGEIYNYLELRAELARAGHGFRSGTDTEVILAAWREWGESCLSRFNGMFAFVLYDARTQRIFAARDRFGVKPLYCWATPSGGLAFASEIKQFTAHPQWSARLNGQAAYDFLNWGLSDHDANTFFAGVRQLRGGECILAPLDALPAAEPRRWYTLQPAVFEGDFAAATDAFRRLFEDAIRLRLRSDVPVGSCLSGGLDSSSIVCAVREQLGGQACALQKTFSAYSDVPRFDESVYIEQVVRATGAESHTVTPQPDTLLRDAEALTWHQDEPFGSTSIFAQWCVFRLARENAVTVMLDGQGADETLAGYHGFFWPRLAGLLRAGRLVAFWREAAKVRALHGQGWTLQTQFLADELLPAAVADPLRGIAGRTVAAPDFLALARLGAAPRSLRQAGTNSNDPVRSLSIAQITSLNLPMLLRFEDRNSMAHGIEARLPFLDYRLVEFCLGLPEEFKLAGGWTKRVLRESMRDRLPESVRSRRDKLGFVTAEESWMRHARRDEFRRLVHEAIDASDGILTAAARAKANQILTGAEPFSFLVWRMISFGSWMRRFNVSLAAGTPAAEPVV